MDPKRRFSGRAGNYERHRRGYPAGVLTFVEAACGPSKPPVVADAGSGTGLLSGLFLENGYRAFGIEPNREMREAAERRLGSCPRFRSVAAAAEATTLPAASVDLVGPGRVLARSQTGRAHRCLAERAGKDRHALSRSPRAAPLRARVGRRRQDRCVREHRRPVQGVEAFFGDGGYETACFRSARRLDFEGLKGLMFSHSNMPTEVAQQGPRPLLGDLEAVFRANESGGELVVEIRRASTAEARNGWRPRRGHSSRELPRG